MNDVFNPNLPPDDSQAAVFELIFHNTHTFTGLLRTDGTLLEVNRPALELLGLERGEVVGRPVWQLPAWSPAARPAVEAAVVRAGRGELGLDVGEPGIVGAVGDLGDLHGAEGEVRHRGLK